MQNKYILILSILFFVELTPVSAQVKDFREVKNIDYLKEKLADHSKSTNSIQSTFVQEKHLWMLNEVIVSEGEFLFKKSNSVKWQYNKPIEYTIVIHDGKFTIVSNNKVSEFDIASNPMFQEINKMIVTAIRGDFIDNDDFSAKFMENDEQYLAELTPVKDEINSMLLSIEIYFEKKNMEVSKVIFKEPGDDFTSILFKGKKINQDLSDDKFLISSEL